CSRADLSERLQMDGHQDGCRANDRKRCTRAPRRVRSSRDYGIRIGGENLCKGEGNGIMDSQRFYKWLCSEIGLSPKSARDVVSRVRRASRFIDLSLPVSDSELLFKMSESDEFKN